MSEPTNQEVLDTLHEVAQMLVERIDGESAKIRAKMASKDFVDRRMIQVESKIGRLADILERRDSITKDEARDVMLAS